MKAGDLVRPFRALRPLATTAAAVIAPPYDVVDAVEARALAAGRPDSFLHISRPEIDLDPDTDPHADEVYARGALNLARLIATGTLLRDARPSFYLYRMVMGKLSQTGIALTASVAAYETGRVRRHELTHPDKENDRVRNIEALNAETGPVLSAYRADAQIDELIAEFSRRQPDIEVPGQHEVQHALWCIAESGPVARLTAALNRLDCLYIADGHHRSAAASRVAAGRRRTATTDSHEYFLSVAFAHDRMHIYDYNRVVGDLNGLAPAAFVAAVAKKFDCLPLESAFKPDQSGQFGMYVAGRWYRLNLSADVDSEDPVRRLDVSRLQNHLIEPLLGIRDPRSNPRIGFVGGVRGLTALEQRVDSGAAAVAFALFPTAMEQLMAVADGGLLMPPKSTWFEPKLADGLLTHVLD
jgi:uncharacterized protein (DUF1015 family)